MPNLNEIRSLITEMETYELTDRQDLLILQAYISFEGHTVV
jgi:hypothetical protein